MPGLPDPLLPLGRTNDLAYWVATDDDFELGAGWPDADGVSPVHCKADRVYFAAENAGWAWAGHVPLNKRGSKKAVIFRKVRTR